MPETGGIDGDVMIIGTRNCVDQKKQFKIQEDLQDSSIDHTKHTSEDDEHESSDGESCVIKQNHGKVYVQDSYWMDVDAEKVDQLPYDVDGAKIYLIPFDPKKRFTSTKDGRPWANIFESKHSAWSGDRCMAKNKGSFECFNLHCPYYLQFHKCNRRQFTPKGACKSCGQFSERGTCEARKIWEFPGQWGEKIVTVKHFGTHSP